MINIYSTSNELVSIQVTYLNQTLKSNLSKTARWKLKKYINTYRASFILSEYIFTFELCTVVFAIVDDIN